MSDARYTGALDPSYTMGEQSPLRRPVTPLSGEVPGESAVRQAMRPTVQRLHKVPTPLDLAIGLGGGPGGSAMAMAAGPAKALTSQAASSLLSKGVAPAVSKDVVAAAGLAPRGQVPLAERTPQGIRAYHGSPHDFERFDMSKIGTGEGAQAYGHGLYFAENPGVAADYKTRLAPTAYGQGTPEWLAANRLNIYGTPQAAVKSLRETGAGHPPENVQKAIDLINSGFNPTKGKTYEVSISADPDHFLHWDKPLSEQSPKVQQAMKKVWDKAPMHPHIGTIDFDPKKPGYQLLSELESGAPSSWVSSQIRDAGIPGIKYLDQGSRGAGKGTHNYVVFDDKLINIIKKYGIAAFVAGGAGHFAMQDQRRTSAPRGSGS